LSLLKLKLTTVTLASSNSALRDDGDYTEICWSRFMSIFNVNLQLTTVTLANSNSALPDDGDYTETCWSCFNVNFNTLFKVILLCIS
jgi:hypothetical protein